MNSGILILRKEIVSFLRNDRSALVVQILLILVWSAFLAANFSSTRTATTDLGGYPGELLWWVFFSVVVSGNFAGTVFVSERIQGSMEILLTSGLTRRSVLWGKIGFVLLMSFLVGFVCYGASLLWLTAWSPAAFGGERIPLLRAAGDLGLFVSATWMNATCGAWLSLRLPNPRLSHFAVFLVFSVMVMLHIVLWFLLDPLIPPLWAWFCIAGVVFAIVADRGFHGEKVVQPVRM
jgi:hypothetical protein